MSHWVVVGLLALALAFSGCTQGTATQERTDPDDPDAPIIPEGLVTDETGAILGVVTDESLHPLEGVTLGLDGETTTATGIDGAFSFAKVLPGEHVIAASRDGYIESLQAVDIVAGEVTEARIRLTSTASASAFYETKIVTGLIGCGAAVLTAGVQTTPALCYANALAPPSINQHITDFILGERQEAWTGFWVETTWQSTQAFGGSMNIDWWTASAPAGTTGRVAEVINDANLEGPSPLRATFNVTAVQGPSQSQIAGASNFCEKVCIISGGHFASSQRLAGDAAGVGLTLQQRFDDYLTVFHHLDPPTDFSALADG
ncbi:MAG TPA: carboxypeptidase-like regulatory domain-containing protein [Candidatus Thermoplasmatota archaeon]